MSIVHKTRLLHAAAVLLLVAACNDEGGTGEQQVTLDSIEVTPASPSLAKGLKVTLVATGLYSDATKKDLTAEVTWASSNSSVASVGNAGETRAQVSGLTVGEVDISASILGKTGKTHLTVTAATVVTLTASAENTTLAKGLSTDLASVATFTDGTNQTVTDQVQWTTSNADVATVVDGKFNAVDVGTAQLKASLQGKDATINVTVTDAELVMVTLDEVPSTSLPIGTTLQLKANAKLTDDSSVDITDMAQWTSTDADKATVTAEGPSYGKVTALAEGTTTVKATYQGKSSQLQLTITPAELVSLAVAPVAPATTDVYAGHTAQLAATGTFTDATELPMTTGVIWETDNAAIADVSNAAGTEGLVTAHAAGTAKITAKKGSVAKDLTITVLANDLKTIRIEVPANGTPAGLTAQLKAFGTYADSLEHEITSTATWTSADASAADFESPNSPGLVTAHTVGTVKVTAALDGISQDEDFVVSAAELSSIVINGLPTATFYVGDTKTLTAHGTFTDGTDSDLTAVTWESSDPTLATVTDGLLTAVKAGQVTIKASKGTVEKTATIDVTAVVLSSIAVAPDSGTNVVIPKGKTLQLKATGTYNNGQSATLTDSVQWGSDAATTASVSDAAGTKGLVTSEATSGTARITATLDGVTGHLDVTASPAVLVSIAITDVPASITEGDTLNLKAIGTYSDGTTPELTTDANILWESLDATKADFFDNGVLETYTYGQVTIKVTLGTVNTTQQLTIKPALDSITVTGTKTELIVDDTLTLTASGENTDGSTATLTNITWTSSDPLVATVSSTGLVTAISPGDVTITATVGTVEGTWDLTIEKKLVSIAVTSAGNVTTIENGENLQLIATGTYSHGDPEEITDVAWTSSNNSIATVDADGYVTAAAEGTVTLTATNTLTGKHGEITITIVAPGGP